MKKKVCPSVFFRITVGILILASTVFWIKKSLLIFTVNEDYLFSVNKFSGVKLSRDIDARPPKGRASGTNSYASFLAEATNLVSKVRNEAGFIYQQNIPNGGDFGGGELSSAQILPINNGDQYFGMQAKIGLKINKTIGDASSIRNRWAYLVNKSQQKHLVYFENIDDESIAWVRGDVPFGFFPVQINILQIRKRNESVFFQLYSDLTHVVRGGVVSTSRPTVMLRHLPYIKYPFSQRFNYLPLVGDVLEFKNGEFRSVKNITPIADSFFLELDSEIKPYFASNNDIVTINSKKQVDQNELKIIVSDITNKNFAFGKGRYSKISVDFGKNTPKAGDYISSDRGGERYYVSYADQNSVTIDLLNSKLDMLCRQFKANNSLLQFTAASQDGFNESNFIQAVSSCQTGSAVHEPADKLVKYIRSFGNDDKNIMQLFDGPISDQNSISLTSVVNRALDMKILFKSELSAASSQEINKNIMPNVVGRGDIWETYPGSMLNIYYKSLNPAPQELLIHALGARLSEAYCNKFSVIQPSFVALSNPRQFTPWLYNLNWPFFELLLLNYEKYYLNSDFSIWYRPKNKWMSLPSKWDGAINFNASFNESPFSMTLPTSADKYLSLYTLEIGYEIINPSNGLPLIGTSPRLLVSSSGTGAEFPARPPVSLPLSENKFTFPLFVKGISSKPALKIEIIDPLNVGLKYKINVIKWRRVNVESSKLESLLYYAPVYKYVANNIDDDIKLNGVSK